VHGAGQSERSGLLCEVVDEGGGGSGSGCNGRQGGEGAWGIVRCLLLASGTVGIVTTLDIEEVSTLRKVDRCGEVPFAGVFLSLPLS